MGVIVRLNKHQLEAVTYTDNPCLVLAGAGSGKTRVIINKIAYLIRQKGYLAHHIAAVTFTNKAAKEMQERIAQSLDKKELRGLQISTFHTLGLTIIRKEHKALELKANFSLFDDQDQFALLKDLTYETFDNDKDEIIKLKNKISFYKNNLIMPHDAIKQAITEQDKLHASYYEAYQTQLKHCSILDFDDLILLPTLLFKHNADVREKWQNKIRYLLVDEYQDTNGSQYELIKYLVGRRGKFTVVGDDDQSIYSWRGARPQNMALLKNDFPQLNVIKLEQNYRSTERILNAANILIANNPHIFEKKLHSEIGEGDLIHVISADNEELEAEKVVKDLIHHHFMNATQFNDYAILYRGNHQSRLIEKWLMQHRIPYYISGETSFFAKTEIKDIMSYLRLLTNPDDDNAFIRIINTPRREIGPATTQKIGELSKEKKISLFQAALDYDLLEKLPPKKIKAVHDFSVWFQELIPLAKTEPMKVIHEIIQHTEYENWLYETSPSPKAAEIRMANVEQLLQWLHSSIEGYDDKEPLSLEETVFKFTLRDMLERNDDKDHDDSKVQLMTLHASKGLEFPYVYLIGMNEGILPHQNSIDEENIDEERRLTYVGITRAQKQLTLSYSLQRKQYGELNACEPSRFLFELPQDDLDWETTKIEKTAEEKKTHSLKQIELLKAHLLNSQK